MTCTVHQFPVSNNLRAARLVVANPAAHEPDVLDTALTVLDWQGTDADRAKIANMPQPALIAGRTTEQLAEARRIGALVADGQRQTLAAMKKAQKTLEAHGVAEDAPALTAIECAVLLTLMKARRAEAQETTLAVAMRHVDAWPGIVAGGMLGALVLLAVSGWL